MKTGSIIVYKTLQLLRSPRWKLERGQLVSKRPYNLHYTILQGLATAVVSTTPLQIWNELTITYFA